MIKYVLTKDWLKVLTCVLCFGMAWHGMADKGGEAEGDVSGENGSVSCKLRLYCGLGVSNRWTHQSQGNFITHLI